MQAAIRSLDSHGLFDACSGGMSTIAKHRGQRFYSQGDHASSVLYLRRGYVKLSVLSMAGREAVIGILGPGSFLGYACLSAPGVRETDATSICDSIATRIEQEEMSRLLDDDPQFRRLFLSSVLRRNLQVEADLEEHLFNSCEKRLARALVRLAGMEAASGSNSLLSNINQQTLASMVGTTQPHISVLLARFRKQGFVRRGATLQVEESLRRFVSSNAEPARI